MRRFLPRLAVILALCATSLSGDDFWNKKQPDQWSAAEIEHLLSNSPWARPAKVSLEAGGAREGTPQGGGTGNPGGSRGGRGGMGRIGGIGIPLPGGGGVGMPGGWTPGGRSGRGGEGRPSGDFAPAKITVRWDSALPVREALDKSPSSDLCRTKSASENDYYTICAIGLPASTERWRRDDSSGTSDQQDNTEHMKEVLMDQTSLHGKDQSSVFPKKVEIVSMGDTRAVLFMFPKDSRIDDNKELEFESQVGRLKIQATFKPKDMKYRGKLEL